MNVDLTNKVALVTGATSGIGLATAKIFAANGARVVLAAANEAEAVKAAADIPLSCALRMDTTSEAEVKEGVASIQSKYGPVDILVNNAGSISDKHRVTLEQFPTEEWDRMVSADLRALFFVSREVVAAMLKGGRGGRIINISSVLGIVPARLECAFAAAKAGVAQLTRTMAIEFGAEGILTNCVAPGSVLTAGNQALFYGSDATREERTKQLLNHIPVGRPGTVEEIANTILFLVAPESGYINGQVLCVDGGWTAGGFLRDF